MTPKSDHETQSVCAATSPNLDLLEMAQAGLPVRYKSAGHSEVVGIEAMCLDVNSDTRTFKRSDVARCRKGENRPQSCDGGKTFSRLG